MSTNQAQTVPRMPTLAEIFPLNDDFSSYLYVTQPKYRREHDRGIFSHSTSFSDDPADLPLLQAISVATFVLKQQSPDRTARARVSMRAGNGMERALYIAPKLAFTPAYANVGASLPPLLGAGTQVSSKENSKDSHV